MEDADNEERRMAEVEFVQAAYEPHEVSMTFSSSRNPSVVELVRNLAIHNGDGSQFVTLPISLTMPLGYPSKKKPECFHTCFY